VVRAAYIRQQQDLIRERARAQATSPVPRRRPYHFRPKPSGSPWDSGGFLVPGFRPEIAPEPPSSPSSDTPRRYFIDANSQSIIDQNPQKPLQQRIIKRHVVEDRIESRHISLDEFQKFLDRQQRCAESHPPIERRRRFRSFMNRSSKAIVGRAALRKAKQEEEEEEECGEDVAPQKPEGRRLDEIALARIRAIKLSAIRMELEAEREAPCTFMPAFVSSDARRRRAKSHEEEIRAGARKKQRVEAMLAESEARREQDTTLRVPRTPTPRLTRELGEWMQKFGMSPSRARKNRAGSANRNG
jgi:hypothetical protein